jgi:mono/diheme cytochrome c family protein
MRKGASILRLSLALALCAAACDSGPDWGMPPAAKDRLNPVPAGQNLAQTESLYADRCARCHGDHGAGDGPDANLYKPPPKSLSGEEVRMSTDGELFWKISKGRRPMPGYGNELSEEQRWQLVNLLRTFATKPESGSAAPEAK